jgi:hypothetical protein
MIILNDYAHEYNLSKLNKDILNYPTIKIDKKILMNHLIDKPLNINQKKSKKIKELNNISKKIVLFNDLRPISDWIDIIKENYINIIKKEKEKYISCILIQYIDLRKYIIKPKNKYIYIKKSKIQGKGIFALNDIPKGTEIMIFLDHIKGIPFIYDDSMFINHSKDSNVFLKKNNKRNYSILISNRLIHKNEELLINYYSIYNIYPWLGNKIEFLNKTNIIEK